MPKKQFDPNPIAISSFEDLEKLKKTHEHHKQRVIFKCVECGKEVEKRMCAANFTFECKECKTRKTNILKYGVENPFKSETIKNKIKETNLKKYGVENVSQIEDIKKAKVEKLREYSKSLGVDWFTKSKEVKNKAISTNQEKYGFDTCFEAFRDEINQHRKETCKRKYKVENVFLIPEIVEKRKATLKARYGAECYWQTEQFKKDMLDKYGAKSFSQTLEGRQNRSKRMEFENLSFDSSWELYFFIWCIDHNKKIEQEPYSIDYEFEGRIHKYFPDFVVDGELFEIKGEHFFKDDGTMQNPFDHSLDGLFEAKHQCMLKNNVKILRYSEMKEYIEYVNEMYTPDFIELFKTGIPFPYPNQSLSDKSDMGLIRHFHKSIWEASKRGQLSPLDAWNQKKDFYKVALNRLQYVGHCRPEDIIRGYSVMRINDKISVFKPTLASKLIKKYLNEFSTVFDPFSGFSGRLIGTINCDKKYIGQDIHPLHIDESKMINDFKKGDAELKVQDILTDSEAEYECLFTCPPYGGKEHWNKNNDEIEKSCDEWIDICLKKYKCKKYLFVVDTTEKFKDSVVEEITNRSHFGENKEYVLLFNLNN